MSTNGAIGMGVCDPNAYVFSPDIEEVSEKLFRALIEKPNANTEQIRWVIKCLMAEYADGLIQQQTERWRSTVKAAQDARPIRPVLNMPVSDANLIMTLREMGLECATDSRRVGAEGSQIREKYARWSAACQQAVDRIGSLA